MAGYKIDRQLAEFGEHLRGWRMVLGVTAQQVSCLHVLPATDFAGEMAAARDAQEPARHD